MTTTPVPTCTDDLLSEIELDFQSARKLGREAYIDMQDGEALIARLRAAEVDAERYRGMRAIVMKSTGMAEDEYNSRADDVIALDAAMQEASK